jgi:hypothetical protein
MPPVRPQRMALLSQFLIFVILLALLIELGRWVTRQTQTIGWLLTGDQNATMVGYYLLMFPGIVLHEASHYFTAKLLGIKVTNFRLGPRRHKNAKTVELGSVTVHSGGPIRDSLVGVAPFVAGTAVLLLVSYLVLDMTALGAAWDDQGWRGFIASAQGMPKTPDFWVWLYVIFAVSNAMMPSESDRKPWLLAGLYVAGIVLLAWVLGAFSFLSPSLWDSALGALQVLTLAFLFTVIVNAMIGTLLWIMATALVKYGEAQNR